MPQIMRFMLIFMSFVYSVMAVGGPFIEEAIVIDPENGEVLLKFSGNIERSGGNSSILTVSDFIYTDNSGGNVTAISAMGVDADASDGDVTVLVDAVVTDADLNSDTIAFDTGAGLVDMADGVTAVQGLTAVLTPDTSTEVVVNVHNVFMGNLMAGSQTVLFQMDITAQNQNIYLDKIVLEFPGLNSFDVDFIQFDDLTNGGPSPIYADLGYDDGVNAIGSTNTYLMAGNALTLGVNVSLNSANTLPTSFDAVVVDGEFIVGGNPNGMAGGNIHAGTFNIDNSGGNMMGGGLYYDIVGDFPFDGNLNRIVVEYNYVDGEGFGLWLEVLGEPGYIISLSANGATPGAPSMVLYEDPDPMDEGQWEYESFDGGNGYATLADLQSQLLGGASSIEFYFETTDGFFVETVTPAATSITATAINVSNPASPIPPETETEVGTSFNVDWTPLSQANLQEIEVDLRMSDNNVFESGELDPATSTFFVDSGLVGDAQYDLLVSNTEIISVVTNTASSTNDDYQFITQNFYDKIIPITTGNAMSGSPEFTADIAEIVIEKNYDSQNGFNFEVETSVSENVLVELFTPNGTSFTLVSAGFNGSFYQFMTDEAQLFDKATQAEFDTAYGTGNDYELKFTDTMSGANVVVPVSFTETITAVGPTVTAPFIDMGSAVDVSVDVEFQWTPVANTDFQEVEVEGVTDTNFMAMSLGVTPISDPSLYSFNNPFEQNSTYRVFIGNNELIGDSPYTTAGGDDIQIKKAFWRSTSFYMTTETGPGVDRVRVAVNRDEKATTESGQEMFRFRTVVIGRELQSADLSGNPLVIQYSSTGNSLYFETDAMPSSNVDMFIGSLSSLNVNYEDSSSDSFFMSISIDTSIVPVNEYLEIESPKDGEGVGEYPYVSWASVNVMSAGNFSVVKVVNDVGDIIHVSGTATNPYEYPIDLEPLTSMQKYEIRAAEIHVQNESNQTSGNGKDYIFEESLVYENRSHVLQTETMFGPVDIDGGLEELIAAYAYNVADGTYQFKVVLLADSAIVTDPIITSPNGQTISLELKTDKVYTYESIAKSTASEVLTIAPAGTYTFTALVNGVSQSVTFEMVSPVSADLDINVAITDPAVPSIIDPIGPYSFVVDPSAAQALIAIMENDLLYPDGVIEGKILQPVSNIELDHEEFGSNQNVSLSVMATTIKYKTGATMNGDGFRIYTGVFSRASEELLTTGGVAAALNLSNDPGFAPATFTIEGLSQNVEVSSFVLSTDAGSFSETVTVDQLTFDVNFPSSTDISTDFSAATLQMPSGNTASGTVSGAGNQFLFSGLSSEINVEPGFPMNVSLLVSTTEFPAFGDVTFTLDPTSVVTSVNGNPSGNAAGEIVMSTFNVGSGIQTSGNLLARASRFEADPEFGSMELGVAGNVDVYFSIKAAPSDTGFDVVEIGLPPSFYQVSVVEVALGGNTSAGTGSLVPVVGATSVVDEGLGTVRVTMPMTYGNAVSDNVFRIRIQGTPNQDSNQGSLYMYLNLENTAEQNFLSANPNDATIQQIADAFPGQISVNPPAVVSNNIFEAIGEISSANIVNGSGVETNTDATFDVYVNALFDATTIGIDQFKITHPLKFNENDMSGNAGVITGPVSFSVWDGVSSFVDASANVTLTRRLGSLQLNTDYVINEDSYLKITFDAFTGNVSTNAPFNFNVELNNTSNLAGVADAFHGEAQPTADVQNGRFSLDLPFILGSGAPEGPSVTDLFYEISPQSIPRTSSEVNVKTFVYYDQGSGSGFDKMYVNIPPEVSVIQGSVQFSFDAGASFGVTGFTSTIYSNYVEITFDADQTGSANLQMYMTLNTPGYQTTSGTFSVEVEKVGRLNSFGFASPSDLNNDGKIKTTLTFTDPPSTYANVSGINFEAQARDAYAGNLQYFVNTDSSPYWHVFIDPVISSSANDQGFNRIFVNLMADQFELGANNPTGVRIYTVASNDVSTSANWQLVSDNVTFPAQTDPDQLQVSFGDVQTDDSLTYVLAFRKRVPAVNDYVRVSQVGINNTNNLGAFLTPFNPSIDVDGDSAYNTDGFPVESTIVYDQDPVNNLLGDLESSSTNVFINETASYSLFLRASVDSVNNTGYDRVKVFYPVEIPSVTITNIATSSSSNLSDSVITSSDYVLQSLYTVDDSVPGEIKITLSNKVSASSNIRINFSVTAPSQPLFRTLETFVVDTSTGRFNKAVPYPLIGSEGHMDIKVDTNVVLENLSEVLSSASTELIVVPADSSNDFVVPGSRPKMSFVVSTTQTANEAGFDIMDVFAAPGFELPSTFQVYRSANTTNLNLSSSLLDASEYTVSLLDQGTAKITFASTQSYNLIGGLSGYTPGQAYYRIEFTPNAPQEAQATRGYFNLEITNSTNDKPAPLTAANVMNGSDLYPGETSLDYDDTGVDVFTPFVANVKDPVSLLEAEASIIDSSGTKVGSAEVNTEVKLAIDFVAYISDNVNIENGFDRVLLTLPSGFSEPFDVKLVRKYNDGSSLTFSENVLVSTAFNIDTQRLIVSLVNGAQNYNGNWNYELSMRTVTSEFSGFINIPNFGVNYSQEPNFFPASSGDADDSFNGVGTAPNNQLSLDILNATVADLTTQYSAVVDDLIIEVDPSSVTSGTKGASVTVYVKADNINSQRGFDYLVVNYPYLLSNLTNIKAFKSTNGTDFTQMDIGLGLSSVSNSTEFKELKMQFSEKIGVASDVTIKLTFNADFPTATGEAHFYAQADIIGVNYPSPARSGDASSKSANNKSTIFIEPDATAINFNLSPLQTFKAEVVGGNAISGNYITGDVVAGSDSFVDIYFLSEQGPTSLYTGFTGMKLYVPFPMDASQLKYVRISKANPATYTGPSDFTQIPSDELSVSNSINEIQVTFDSDAVSQGNNLYRVRMRIEAPEFDGVYGFGMSVFSSNNQGVFQEPSIEGVPLISESLTPNNSDLVDVIPDLGNVDLTAVFNNPLVTSLTAEVAPAFVVEDLTQSYTVSGYADFDAGDRGFDRIRLVLPTAFGTPGAIKLSIGGVDQQPNTFTAVAESGKIAIKLIDSTISSDTLFAVKFDASIAEPGVYEVKMEVRNSADTVSVVSAGIGDVAAGGDSGLFVNIYSDYNTITYVDPVDDLNAELNAVLADGTNGTITTGKNIKVTYFLQAGFDAGTTASGFDRLRFHVPTLFGSFPTTLSVNVNTNGGSSNFLVQDSVNGFSLDTSEPYYPLIKFGKTYTAGTNIKVTFNVTAPSTADIYEIDAFVSKSGIGVPKYVGFGLTDLDGNAADSNRIGFSVFKDTSVDLSNFKVLTGLYSEINLTGTATELYVNTAAKLKVSARALNPTGSGNGFNKIRLTLDPSVTFGEITSLKTASANLVKGTNYTVDSTNPEVIILNLKSTLASSANLDFDLSFTVNTPADPAEILFKLSVDNTALNKPIVALPTRDSTSLSSFGGSNNRMRLNVIKDYTGLLTGGVVTKKMLTNLVAEAVFVDDSNQEAKKAEASSSSKVRVYVKPQATSTDLGINRLRVTAPTLFSKPSNVSVFVNGTFSTNVERKELRRDSVDYKLSVTDLNQIQIDFSVAQSTSYVSSTNLLKSSSSPDKITSIEVEFVSQLPEDANPYPIKVEVDNTLLNLPRLADAGDVNGNNDDNGDGVDGNFGDNKPVLRVTPIQVASDVFADINNATSLTAEITSLAVGEAGSTTDISVTMEAEITASDNGIDRLVVELPPNFANVSDMVVSAGNIVSGNFVGSELVEINDYTPETSDVSNLKVVLNQVYSTTTAFVVSFNVELPVLTDQGYPVKVFVNNSSTSKRVPASPLDVVDGGSDGLVFAVDPPAVSDDQLQTATLLTTLTAKAGRVDDGGNYSPLSILSGSGNTVDFVVNATFSGNDVGFDKLEIATVDYLDLRDVSVVKTVNGSDNQLFRYTNFNTYETDLGIEILFNTPISGDATELTISVGVTAKDAASEGRFDVFATSTSLGLFEFAELSGDSGATLSVPVLGTPKTADELQARAALPVSELLFDLTPGSANVNSIQEFAMYIQATSSAGFTQGDEEIPANTGFDQVFVTLPQTYGDIIDLKLYDYGGAFGSNITELQLNLDYSFSQVENVVTVELFNDLLVASGNEKVAAFTANLTLAMPEKKGAEKLLVSVDSVTNPNEVPGSAADLDSDNKKNDKIIVKPSSAAKTTQGVTDEARASILLSTNNSNAKINPEVSETSFSYSIRLDADFTSGYAGFDGIELALPTAFNNVVVTGIKASSSGNLTPIVESSTGYSFGLDPLTNIAFIGFASTQQDSSGNAVDYYEISIQADMPPENGTYYHSMSLIHFTEGDLDVAPGYVLTDTNETGTLGLAVVLPSQNSAKVGFYGTANGSIIDSLAGSFQVWDEVNSSFGQSVASTDSPVYNVVLETTPVFTASSSGFDYLKIELPYGTGEPVNTLIAFQSTSSGNLVYLEEFYDYRIRTTPSAIIIQFVDETGAAVVVDADLMSNTSNGIFAKKLGFNATADKMLVNFDIQLPSRLGRHYFDAYVLNTDPSLSEIYYLDSPDSNNPRETVIGGNSGAGAVQRTETKNGTRFSYIELTNSSSVAAVSGVTAELVPQGGTTLPVNDNRRMFLDVEVDLSAGASDSFDQIELQLPYGFASVTNFTLSEYTNLSDESQLTDLEAFVDYEADFSHESSVMVTFLSPLDGSSATTRKYRMSFDIQTPVELGDSSLTQAVYTFGVVASLQESGVLTKSAVYATGGDVVSSNASSSLAVDVQVAATISGTVTLDNPAMVDLLVKAEMMLQGTTTVLQTKTFIIDAGGNAGTYLFDDSDSTDQTVSIAAGTYEVVITANQYNSGTVSSLVIVNSQAESSLSDNDVTLTSKSVQATGALSISTLPQSSTNTITYTLNTKVHSSYTSLNLNISLDGTTDSSGNFVSYSVTGVTVGGTAISSSLITSGSSGVDIDLSGETLGSTATSIVVTLQTTTDEAQDGLFDVATTFTIDGSDTSNAYLASTLNTADARVLLNVGDKSIRLLTTTFPDAVIGAFYSHQVNFYRDSTVLGTPSFSISGLTGFSISSTGLISGTSSLSGDMPFTVSVSFDGDTDSRDYTLSVVKGELVVRSIQPKAVPTTGGFMVIKGVGFTSATVVQIDGVAVDASKVTVLSDLENIIVELDAASAGSYAITVIDGDEVFDVPSSFGLVRAASQSITSSYSSKISDGAAPDSTDFDILGIKGFYQDSIYNILVNGLGPVNNTSWRAFSATNREVGVNINADDTTSIAPGQGFWLISRVSGNLSGDMIAADAVDSYAVTLLPDNSGWNHVANMFDVSVSWSTDVTVLSGNTSDGSELTVSQAGTEVINQNLWGMNPDATSGDTTPYTVYSSLEPGQGYWVQNKTGKSITMIIKKPATQLAKPTAEAVSEPEPEFVSFKAGEDEPPEVPVTFQKAGSSASGGGGGGCLLR